MVALTAMHSHLTAPGPQDRGGHALAVRAVVPSAGEAGQVAGPVGGVRQVQEPPCHLQRPPPHRLAAVGAQVAGPVQREAAFPFGLVPVVVAALRGMPPRA